MKLLFALLLLLPLAQALTLQGTIYDFSLNPIHAIVEINTTPKQVFVAKNGSYRFTIHTGHYTLKARHAQNHAEATEEILARYEGQYTLDLILFPTLDEDLPPEDNGDLNELETLVEDPPSALWFWTIGAAVLLTLTYFALRKPNIIVQTIRKEIPLPQELHDILRFIEHEGGRTTQKAIHKHFSYSEAKISLMLDELEAKGFIQKIKKGRSNLILKK